MTTVTHGNITASASGTIIHLRSPLDEIRIHHLDIDNVITCLQDLRDGGFERDQLDRKCNRAHLDLIGDLFHRLCKENERCKDADPELAIHGVRWSIRQIQSYCQTIGVDPRTIGKRAISEAKAKEKREEANALRCRATVLEAEAHELEREPSIKRCSVCGAWMTLDADIKRGFHPEHQRP